MVIKTIDYKKNKLSLKELLALVSAGTEITITDGDTPIARIVPAGIRGAGLHSGAISTSNDFDEPLPDQFWTSGK